MNGFSELMNVAIQAALRSGDILKRGFGTLYEISNKPGIHNLVTQYDKLSEETIIQSIQSVFPHHSFLAEESGQSGDQGKDILWVIDPLDGTVNFAHNIPLFAISIAAVIQGSIEIGLIYLPMTQELYTAEKGKGAFMNGSQLSVSSVNQLEKSIAATGHTYHAAKGEKYLTRFAKAAGRGNPMRDLGAAAVHLAYLAAGRFDIYWIDSLQPWDIAAGILLIQEAGGEITHYNGRPYQLFDTDLTVLASNGVLHSGMIECLG